MNAFHRQLHRVTLAIVVTMASAAAPMAVAQEFMAPTYSRTRGGAGDWSSRGWHGGGWGWGGGYGFVQPFFPQPIVTGSWYQRPYPYHFDYYRYRWGGQEAPMAPADCPCAVDDHASPDYGTRSVPATVTARSPG